MGFDSERSPEQCIFCEIIKGQAEASIILRDEEKGVISFMDLQGYPLVCPIEHVDSTYDSLVEKNDLLAEVNKVALGLVPHVYEAYATDSVNIITNLGGAAGQEIPHIHTHVIPRFTQDHRVRLQRLATIDREELDNQAARLRELLKITQG